MDLRSLLLNDSIHFLFFGGKGGVGKTTFAATSAIWAAEHGRRVLVVSTDPAHSLSDSLSQKFIYGKISPIESVDNLSGLEIQSNYEISNVYDSNKNWDEKETPKNGENTLNQTGLGLEMLLEMKNVIPPGLDEVVAFSKLLEFLQSTDYDLVIFDTAPTGHTLRFLGLPDLLSSWMGNMLKLKLKFGKFLSNLKSLFSNSKENPQEELLDNLELIKSSIEEMKRDLTNSKITSFIIVTIPEAMAIFETERLLGTLMQYNINSQNIIVNHVIPENSDCDFCQSRRKMQRLHIQEIKEMYKNQFTIYETELRSFELRTVEILRKFGKDLISS